MAKAESGLFVTLAQAQDMIDQITFKARYEMAQAQALVSYLDLPVRLPKIIICYFSLPIQKLSCTDVWEDNNLVFCSEFGTPHSIPNLTYRYFRPVLKKTGLPQIRIL